MMATFIARRIEEKKDNYSLEEAQNLYRAFFVKVSLYKKWQSSVDTILIIDGYEDCIVTE